MSKKIFVCLKQVKNKCLLQKMQEISKLLTENIDIQLKNSALCDGITKNSDIDYLITQLFNIFFEILEIKNNYKKAINKNVLKNYSLSSNELICKLGKDIYKINYDLPFIFVLVKRNINKKNKYKDIL